MPDWVVQDLRRTARSKMSRTGIPQNSSGRALGHVLGGIEGIYDRSAYAEEKRRVFAALANEIGSVFRPTQNVAS